MEQQEDKYKDKEQESEEEEEEEEEYVDEEDEEENKSGIRGGNPVKFDKFDDFLRKRAVMNGGADDEEYREGYDSFTIVEASDGEVGGRFISKTPYSAASKAASRLFKSASSKNITFVMKKITKGSNKKFYAYEASIKILSKPKYIFKKDESGNKITTNNYGQIVKINKNNKVINTADNKSVEYNPEQSLSKLKSFDYKPYVIKQVSKEITIKATDIPDEYKVKKADKLTKEEKQLLKTEKKQKEQELKELIKENKKQEKEQLKIQKELEKEQLKIQKEIQKIDNIPDKKKGVKQHERELLKKNKDLDKELLKMKKESDKENKKIEKEQLKIQKDIEKLDKTEMRKLLKTNKKQIDTEYTRIKKDLKKLEQQNKKIKGGGGTCSASTSCF